MLSQRYLDRMAQTALVPYGARAEQVTYRHRTTVSATATSYTVNQALFLTYNDRLIALHAAVAADRPMVLRTDRPMLIPTALVSWTPTTADEVVRADGTAWRIMAIAGGPGSPFYILQGRKTSPA